jgi:hypothetical protein
MNKIVKSIVEKYGYWEAVTSTEAMLDKINLKIFELILKGLENETNLSSMELYCAMQKSLINILNELNVGE